MVMANLDGAENTKNTDARKMNKIQIFPSKMYCGYNKMSNQLPKLTKTIMSPLTTMPPKKMIVMSPTAMKPNPTVPAQNTIKVEDKKMPESRALSEIKPKIELKPEIKATDKSQAYRPEKISLEDVHPYITCFICRGYLIEATTIVECLHTYCHSCLMKHLSREKCCPQCGMAINKSKTNIK